MAYFSLTSQALVFGDPIASSNPTQRYVDWTRKYSQIPVSNARSNSYSIEPLSSVAVFDGTRSTSVSDTTQFSVALSPINSSTYRFSWTAVGTAPAFRTDRALTLSGLDVTLVTQANNSVVVTVSVGSPFGAVTVGDVVFLPGTTTGDSAGPFSALNEGEWSVITASASSLTITRPVAINYSAIGEVVSITSNTQFQAYTAAGVQVGDVMDLSAGFATPMLKNFTITAVNPKWVEFSSTVAIGVATGVPQIAGIAFYTSAKKFVKIEADQEVIVRFNGDTGNTNRICPFLAGDPALVGYEEKVGPVFKLILVNRSSVYVNALVVSVE
jgi:hypothetical protein